MRTDVEIVEQTNKLALLLVNQAGYNVPEGHKFYESEDPRSVSAWKRACEIQGMLTATNPDDALSNLDEEPTEYPVRLWMTARMMCETTVSATSEADAIEKAKALDFGAFDFVYENQEGDESVHICNSDDPSVDPIEVDLRPDGEPFSWEAVRIVKELAALHGMGWESADIVRFISRAHRACTKITGGMEG